VHECACVTLRISIRDAPSGRILHVEGRLTREEVPELEGVLGAGRTRDRLDLSNLLSVDACGLAALRRLRAAGFEMIGTPTTLKWKIEDDGP
jgi:ABC-type transporter Mla MlaB component